MTAVRSPIRSPLRSPLYSPLVGKFGGVPFRLGFLGDSIMASNHDFPAGDNAYATAQGIGEVNWASALYPHFEYDTWWASGAIPNFTGMNSARGGDTSTLTLGRVATLYDYSPDVVLVAVGTNDVTLGTAAATVMANIEDICEYYLARHIPVILATIRPRGVSLPEADARRTLLLDINTLIRAYAAASPSVYLWDSYLVYDDGTGHPIAGYMDSGGTHLTRTGAAVGGASLVTVLQQLFPTSYSYIPSNIINSNSQMTGTTGVGGTRSTGTFATGWTCQFSGTGTATNVGSKNGSDKQVLTITPQASGSADEVFVIAYSGLFSVTPGTWYRSYSRVRLAAWTGWRAVTGLGYWSGGIAGADMTTSVIAAPSEVELDIVGPPWKCPAGTTTIQPLLNIHIDGTAVGTGVATVERMGVAEISDPRPLHGLIFDDYFNYADTTALLAAWTPGATTPLVTLQSAPSRMRVENGAASSAYAARSFTTVAGRSYRLTGNVIAKGANQPRVYLGTSANSNSIAQVSITATGTFTKDFTATGATTFITVNTTSVTIGHFVEIDDLLVVAI